MAVKTKINVIHNPKDGTKFWTRKNRAVAVVVFKQGSGWIASTNWAESNNGLVNAEIGMSISPSYPNVVVRARSRQRALDMIESVLAPLGFAYHTEFEN